MGGATTTDGHEGAAENYGQHESTNMEHRHGAGGQWSTSTITACKVHSRFQMCRIRLKCAAVKQGDNLYVAANGKGDTRTTVTLRRNRGWQKK